MSENVLRLITTNPLYVPSSATQDQAHNLLVSLLPEGEVRVVVTRDVSFIDPGANFECILCPICGAVVSMEWWGQVMDRSYAVSRFRDLSIIMPCCQAHSSLNDLLYEWPAGFARFFLETHSVDLDLTEQQLSLFEPLLGCSVRKIWTRY
jgi:hypothetical protein